MKVSAYDHVASWLVSFLVVSGVCVLALFLVWMSRRLPTVQWSVPVEAIEYSGYGGRGDHAAGFGRDAELGEPGMEPSEEAGQTAEPSMEASLEAVTQVVASTAIVDSLLETISSSPVVSAQSAAGAAVGGNPVGGGTGIGWGKGKGIGDSRGPGPLGEGRNDLVPPWERWEIRFTTSGRDAYARQIDFFKIELAAVGGAPQVDYALNVSKPRPDRRSGKPEDEKRIYMTWEKTGGPLAAFDRQLLENAGIRTQRRMILQFYPKATEDLLGRLEATQAAAKGHRDPREFYKTIFGVRAAGNGYEFFVIDQRFRPAPRL
jgi:hypothetical protein